jgi:Peptidase_C39 like family
VSNPYHPKHSQSATAKPARRRGRAPVALTAAALLAAALGTDIAVTRLNSGAAPADGQAVAAMNMNQRDADRASREQVRAVPSVPGSAATPGSASTPAASAGKAPQSPPVPASKVLKHEYQAQINFYYCGPAATRIAMTALGLSYSQDAVAAKLGTTVNGTNSADDVTRVLNQVTKGNPYKSTFFAGTPSKAQITQLRSDVVKAVSSNRPVVANIAGAATDTSGNQRSFPGGHYIAVVGYYDRGRTVRISDPANVYGIGDYSMTIDEFANWLATRGYSA